MTRVAIRYSSIGIAIKGVGGAVSNLMIGVAGEGCVPGEVYTIGQVDAQNTTFIGASVQTPKGGLEIPGFPRDLRDKVVRFATPGEIAFSAESDNRVEFEIFENDGQLTSIFKYVRYVKGMWIWNPSDLTFEGVAKVRYGPGMRGTLLSYLFKGPVKGDECLAPWPQEATP